MKTSISKLSAALVLVAVAASANAQSVTPENKFYGEIGYTSLKYEEPAGDANLGALTATLGYEFNKNFAIEGSLGTGIKDDNVTVNVPPPVTVNVDLDNTYAVFLKPKAQLGQNFEVFAKLGWARSKLKAGAGGFSVSDSGSDFAYGAGAQYSFNQTAYITAGYTKLYDKDNVTIDGWNVGLGFKF